MYIRSKAQNRVDHGEDHLHETTALDMSGLGAARITSRIYDLVELRELNISCNKLTRISPNIQYFAKYVLYIRTSLHLAIYLNAYYFSI